MAEPDKKLTASFPATAEGALLKGSKIEAIRIVRAEQGVGLKEAKAIVEQHVATHPGIQEQINNAQALSRRAVLPWLTAIIVIGMLIIFFLAMSR